MADRAILFGINDYESIGDLSGCLNDVNNVRKLLMETFGFPADSIQTFKDEKVTKEAIQDGFDWLVDGAAAGDRLVFHFSGHGSYTLSENDDEQTDELLCLYGMDWNDRNSYLIDDDLGQMASRVARTGARLTIILDCCHSGTGTRELSRKGSRRRHVILESTARNASGESAPLVKKMEKARSFNQKFFDDNDLLPVYARFVSPPEDIQEAASSSRIRRLGDGIRSAERLDHQLLAGAKDSQTAADAFIDGRYNGAFSFYLCKTARDIGAGATVNELMDEVVETVRASYTQIPQNEGPFGHERLFGGASSDTESDSGGDSEAPFFEKDETPSGSTTVRPLETLDRLLRITERLLDLSADSETERGHPVSVREVGDESVVYVHGISKHNPGYSRSWFDAMRRHLHTSLDRHEVLWSPHVNSRSGTQAKAAEVRSFARTIERELAARRKELKRRLPSGARSTAALQKARGSDFAIDDFARYMLNSATRNAILGEFDKIVEPLLRAGRKIHIISHSWGTVVAYEGLRRMDRSSFSGRVSNLFVVGSALSIGAVQSNLFDRVSGGRLPRHVRRIINLDAGGDIVGGPIGDEFAVHREYLGLEPVDCRQIPFTDIALNPACAHSSYFLRKNVDVNRDIFARFIRT